MADAKILQALPEILEQHFGWLADHRQGKQANLSGANLRGADLSGADLRRANLSRADLRVTVLAARTPNEFLGGLRREGELLVGYKGVGADGKNYQGNRKYEVGKTYEEEIGSGDVLTECHPGLHLCTTPDAARQFGEVVLGCGFDIGDVLSIPAWGVSEDKFRVRRFSVLRVYPEEV